MTERVFIGVAWPYANGSLHLGHLAGCYLAADIFARYHRMRGNEVLMVSGSDTHGTPITIRADQEGISPAAVVERYHAEFLETWERLGIGFDLFTHTNTENHRRVVHDIFSSLREQGYIYSDNMLLAYCGGCRRFLPDRYVEGVCPIALMTGPGAISVTSAAVPLTRRNCGKPGAFCAAAGRSFGNRNTFS